VRSGQRRSSPRRAASAVGRRVAARNLKTFSLSQPKISDRISLPDAQGDLMLWPPPTNVAALVPPVQFNPRFSADWGELREQEEQRARDNAARDEQHREQSAIERQRNSGAPVWWRPEAVE
jgi:hypothetical protein